MTALQRFRLKNRLLVANITANLLSAVVITNLVTPLRLSPATQAQQYLVQLISTPLLFLLGIAVLVWYELPMRRYITRCQAASGDCPEAPQQVLRRLLNEPFFAVALDMFIWVLAATFWATYFRIMGEPDLIVKRAFMINLHIGLITVVVAFFLLEHVFQKKLATFFFPRGQIYAVAGAIRVSIRVRLAALILACNFIPFFATIQVYFGLTAVEKDPAVALVRLGDALVTNSLVFMIVGVWLWVLVGTNLSHPFRGIIRALTRVREGRFDDRIQVTSNDELGYTGDVVNQMTEGLKDREQMRVTMMLAREVQQNLLPRSDPALDGLDIAGTSLYCDETGGDYYDYIQYRSGVADSMPMAVVVGDVSGHGAPSALLMATARALLRQRLSLAGDLAHVVTDVNCQLTQDVGLSGQFMTLMILAVDPAAGRAVWVRAGHEPAILYNPLTEGFERLAGPGMALGIDGTFAYRLQYQDDLAEGTVILVGTDGIWEACNARGEMFGRHRARDVLKRHAGLPAAIIRDQLVAALNSFRGAVVFSDDVTLVVLKLDSATTAREYTPGSSCGLSLGTGSSGPGRY